ncbi:MAG TPA: lysophospholipid acyltransferase family protein, partial [Phycisphaerales bacterium]|nr:lysophospholipid acyltransferase family protein [Phycisphaerales bacterium]
MPGETCLNLWIGIGAALWLLLAVVGWWVERSPMSPRPDLSTALAAWLIRVYLRVVHGMKVEGQRNRDAAVALLEGRDGTAPRGLIVTVNHAAGIDPLLVQSSVPFFIRWLAALDTVSPTVRPFVDFADVIFLTSGGAGSELAGVRQVIRYLQGDPSHPHTRGRPGAVGLFPEGRIARRPGVITPFQPGVGVMIARSRAVVLPVVLRGV